LVLSWFLLKGVAEQEQEDTKKSVGIISYRINDYRRKGRMHDADRDASS